MIKKRKLHISYLKKCSEIDLNYFALLILRFLISTFIIFFIFYNVQLLLLLLANNDIKDFVLLALSVMVELGHPEQLPCSSTLLLHL